MRARWALRAGRAAPAKGLKRGDVPCCSSFLTAIRSGVISAEDGGAVRSPGEEALPSTAAGPGLWQMNPLLVPLPLALFSSPCF